MHVLTAAHGAVPTLRPTAASLGGSSCPLIAVESLLGGWWGLRCGLPAESQAFRATCSRETCIIVRLTEMHNITRLKTCEHETSYWRKTLEVNGDSLLVASSLILTSYQFNSSWFLHPWAWGEDFSLTVNLGPSSQGSSRAPGCPQD